MKKLILPTLALLLFTLTGVKAQGVSQLSAVQNLFQHLSLPYNVVDSYNRGDSTPAKIAIGSTPYSAVFSQYSPYYVNGGNYYTHPVTNGGDFTGSWTDAYYQSNFRNSDTNQQIALKITDTGLIRSIQIKSDATSILIFDTKGYSYRLLVSYNNPGSGTASLGFLPTTTN